MGDEILALPFYQLLRRQYPNARVTVGVNHPGLVDNLDGVSVEDDCGEFDCDLFVFAKDDARDTARLRHLCDLFEVQYEVREPALLADLPPCPVTAGRGERLVAYSCGAGWPCKSCTPALMNEVVQTVLETFPNTRVVELGKDCARAGVGEDFVDRLSVMETASLLAASSLYIGPDSGLVHLALAVGTPAVGLYGPVRPGKAFGIRERLHAVASPLDCQGCWTDGRMRTPGLCPLGIASDSPSDYPCVNAITRDVVWQRICGDRLL
jgi:ADP-heptose:LPS heptosyltransferase